MDNKENTKQEVPEGMKRMGIAFKAENLDLVMFQAHFKAGIEAMKRHAEYNGYILSDSEITIRVEPNRIKLVALYPKLEEIDD